MKHTLTLLTALLLAALVYAAEQSGVTRAGTPGQPGLGSAETPLPKLVFTHVMGMMPTVVNMPDTIFPLTAVGDTESAKDRNAKAWSAFGGRRRIAGLGFYYPFLRQDSRYNFNEPYLSPAATNQPSQHPNFTAYAPAHIENPYRWDLQMADEMGIDGFGLCLSGNERSCQFAVGWLDTLEAMLKNKPDTKVRLCPMLCGDELPSPERPEKYAWLRRLIKERGDGPAWLRHDGRLVFMGYHSQMSWDAKKAVDPAHIRTAIARHKEFFASMGIDPVFIFDGPEYVPGQISYGSVKPDPELLGPIAGLACQSFPAYSCWGGVIREQEYHPNYTVISKAVNQSGKAWMMPILDIHSGVGQFYRSLPGVQRLLDTWDFAAKSNARCAQLVTWNDTQEATGFQPSVSWNYALWALTAKFIHRFKHGEFPVEKGDSVFLFYRKYHRDAEPRLCPRATVERDEDKWGETDDLLHVIVFAIADGTVEVIGTGQGVSRLPLRKGFNEFKLTTAFGQEIAARIFRGGVLAHELVSPERVTDRPYREDLVPWGWSSYCRKLYDRDFGKSFYPISYYSERYRDGIPDWFRLHYFGTTERVAGSGTEDDPDHDGLNNRAELAAGTNPRKADHPYPAGYVWDEYIHALSYTPDLIYGDRATVSYNPHPDRHGILTHGFYYAEPETPDGPFRPLTKFVNRVKGVPTSWGFRKRSKATIFLTKEQHISLTLDDGCPLLYRFCCPVSGQYAIHANFSGTTDAEVSVRRGAARLFNRKLTGGQPAESPHLSLALERGEWIDFWVRSAHKGTVTLAPQIRLEHEAKH